MFRNASAFRREIAANSNTDGSRIETLRFARHLVLLIVLISGGITAYHLTDTLEQRADGMTRYVRVDAWTVQQAEYELQLFRSRLAQHVAGEPTVPLSEIKDQLAHAGAALDLMRGEHGEADFGHTVDLKTTAETVATRLNDAERIISDKTSLRGDLWALREIEALLANPFRDLRQLAVDVASVRQELQDGDIANVRWLIGANKWMLNGFLAATALFVLLLLIEVRSARRSERRAQHLSDHDVLTDLPNRRRFQKDIERWLALCNEHRGGLALHLLDLDGFKDINDGFGHAFGDDLLVAVSRRLEGCLSESEILVRIAGDEFAVIQVGENSTVNWRAVGWRLIEAMSAPFEIDGRLIQLGTSIGVSLYPSDGKYLDDLLKAADLALYAAKETRGCVVPFEKAMKDRAEQRRKLLEDLGEAISHDDLELHYQPQIDLTGGRCIGAEALLRWRHPKLGWVSPADIVPLAEESGLIHSLGSWALEKACMDALQWSGQAANASVAVNVSPLQFSHEDIVQHVRDVLVRTGLPAERLELEITETVLMRDEETAITTLQGLQDLGVRLAIDDFGTGYSSLAYLKRFPVDKLKIDRAFVREMQDDTQDKKIVRTIIDLARGLGLNTIAEGIETPSQKSLLEAFGCKEGQGYLFARPMTSSEFQTFVDRAENAQQAAPASEPNPLDHKAFRVREMADTGG